MHGLSVIGMKGPYGKKRLSPTECRLAMPLIGLCRRACMSSNNAYASSSFVIAKIFSGALDDRQQ
jgi:hypothetical protein